MSVTTAAPQTPIRVNATEVASLAGLHPFKSTDYTLCILWCRHDPASYGAAVKRLSGVGAARGFRPASLAEIERKARAPLVVRVPAGGAAEKPKPRRIRVDGNNPRVKQLFQLAERKMQCDDSLLPAPPALAPLVQAIVDAMQSDHGDVKQYVAGIKALVTNSNDLELIVGGIYKHRGLQQEDGSTQLYEEETRIGIRYRQQAFELDVEDSVRISGRLDGVKEGENSFIELKNRQHRFFDQIQPQEECQLQVYMQLTGAQDCELVERFRGEQRITTVRRDDVFWYHTILPKMLRQVQRLREAIQTQDQSVQSQLLLGAQASLQRESDIILERF